MLSNDIKIRAIALTGTVLLSIPFLALAWWAFRTAFLAYASGVDDDNAWLILAVSLLTAILCAGGWWLLVGSLMAPGMERLAVWYVQTRQQQRRRNEDDRIADELHAAEASRAYLAKVLDDARMKAHADREAFRNTARQELSALPDAHRSVGIFARYGAASTYHRMLIREGYNALLDLAHPRHEYHAAMPIADLAPLARLLFLPVAIDATDGPTGFDRLDLDATDHAKRIYIYRSERHVPDIAHWTANLPAIEAYLGGRWRVTRGVGATIVLTGLPDIPETFPLAHTVVKPDLAYLGQNLETGAPVHVPLDQLSHTLVAGPTGMGKSVLLHQLMASVAANLDRFEAIHLVDLKYGLELQAYASLGPKFRLTMSNDDVPALIKTLLTEMDRRGEGMRTRRIHDWDGPLILVVIDEFADILLGEPDKAKRTAIENGLIRLTNLSRALGFRFWVQSQKTTADALPASIRNNLQSVISFRMVTNQAAAMLFGGIEHLPADITQLKRGQAIYRDGRTSETVALQGAFVRFEDVAALAERLHLGATGG